MDDLHKPLGVKEPEKEGGWRWSTVAIVAAAIAASSLAAWRFIDRGPAESVTVALNADGTAPAAPTSTPTSAVDTPQTDESDPDEIQPLSPLEPLDGEDGTEQAVLPRIDGPTFEPGKPVTRNRAAWLPSPDLVEKSEFGPLPKVSDGGIRPLDLYSRASSGATTNRLAIVVGGLGLSQTGTQDAIRQLPESVTLAFSPFGNSLQRWVQTAVKKGHEVSLQLPMEPLGYPTIDPGPQTLTASASEGENLRRLRWSLARMTNYPTVINYLGAGIASNDVMLRPVMAEIQKRGLAFIDDGSVETSKMLTVAKELRLPHQRGTIILDATRNTEKIISELAAAETLARSRGYAIATASAFPESVEVIAKWVEQASRRGISIVPLSSLVKDYPRQ